MPTQIIDSLQQFYRHFDTDSLSKLGSIYDEEIVFIDPLHHLQGLNALHHYFSQMMRNTQSCHFDIERHLVDGNQATLNWTMTFAHPKLSSGRPIQLDGITEIQFADRITYHRDYYDVSAMLHDQLPLIGRLSRALKARLAQ